MFVITRQRTVQQDAGFGIRQIVDIAMKALSPGINDTTTAVMCVDYLAAILVQLAQRQIPTSYRFDDRELRMITRGPSFQSLVAEAFDQIRQNAKGNVAVLTRLLQAFELIAAATKLEPRRQCLQRQAELVSNVAELTVLIQDIAPIKAAMARLVHIDELTVTPTGKKSG
jgi:uncharacterized membrane protein